MSESKSLRGFVVLVIEDDADTLQTVSWVIGDILGGTVLTACSGDEALSIIDGTSVDLVLTNIVMPEMDGLTLTRLIGQRSPSLPVILTTGLTTATAIAERHGASVLLKPYSVEQLAAAISERLSANQPSTVASTPVSGLGQIAPGGAEWAREHVARAEVIVSRQSDIVRQLTKTGFDTALATRMLITFEASLTVMRGHLARKELETFA